MARLPFHDDAPFFTALEAAEHLLHIASERGDPLNHRQLQNLLCYAQGFSQFSLEKLLFPDPIQARSEGPVVAVVEREYAVHGDRLVPVPGGTELNEWSLLAQTAISAVHLEFGTVACGHLTEQLKFEPSWQEAMAGTGVIDPLALASWWQDWYGERQSQRAPRAPTTFGVYLDSHPDVAERLRHPGTRVEPQLLR